MTILEIFLNDFESEAQITRKMLSLVPNDKFDWQPHKKSMTIQKLAAHIAELPGWVAMTLTTDGLDFANNPYVAPPVHTTNDVLAFFEENLVNGREQLQKATEEELWKKWTLRNGEQIYMVASKAEVIRVSLNQVTHHRAQLGVYLRLLDIPIPGSYGPSADESF